MKNAQLSRRHVLKFAAAGLAAGAGFGFFGAKSALAAEQLNPRGKKALIVFYSRSGNTRAAAKIVSGLTGADMVELETATPYPDDYKAATEQARKEQESGFKPPLKTKINNLASYDLILLGSPCWWGTVATPVISFLAENDLSGKTIALFMTHGGSGLGRGMEHVKELCPKAVLVPGVAISGSRAASARDELAAWLRESVLAQ